MTPADLAELMAALSLDLDLRLADMRWRDALRDAACCTSANEADAVHRRFEIAQVLDDQAVAVTEGRLQ